MRRLKELDAQRPELEQYITDTAARMGESAMCLSIFTEDYKHAIDGLLQLAVAMMMDKPIYLLAPQGTKVPEKVRRIADGIEFYDLAVKGSMEAATHRLLADARSKGFCA